MLVLMRVMVLSTTAMPVHAYCSLHTMGLHDAWLLCALVVVCRLCLGRCSVHVPMHVLFLPCCLVDWHMEAGHVFRPAMSHYHLVL